MFQLDDNFLASLGLAAMSKDDKQAFLKHLRSELELRVGDELARDLSEQQLKDFEKLINEEDQQSASQWLENNCPNYKQIVAKELEKLKQEIVDNREYILGQAA